MMEPIPGFSSYKIARDGRIVLYKEPKRSKKGVRVKVGAELSPTFGKYASVTLFNDVGEPKQLGVHQLVALTYLPKPEGAYLVRHLDGDTWNNHVDNLSWGDDQQNAYDMMHHGRCKNQHGMPVFSADTIRQLRDEFARRGISKVQFAKELNVNYWTLRDVLNGKRYRWVK